MKEAISHPTDPILPMSKRSLITWNSLLLEKRCLKHLCACCGRQHLHLPVTHFHCEVYYRLVLTSFQAWSLPVYSPQSLHCTQLDCLHSPQKLEKGGSSCRKMFLNEKLPNTNDCPASWMATRELVKSLVFRLLMAQDLFLLLISSAGE